MPFQEQINEDRRQLEIAIAALEAQRPILGDAVVDAALASMQEKLARLAAQESEKTPQLKFVTILFTDIAGSTHMSQGLDAEDTLAVMDGALQRFGQVVQRHGGRVLRYMGDGLMAIFGAPVAREDDAERAVHAGLSLLEEANRYATTAQERWGLAGFKVRVGLNTGQVVVGAGVEAENTIMGMAINLAARMESSAPPGCLLISHDTYRHVRGLFDVQAQPPLLVKGKDEPLRTYLVLRATPRSQQTSRRGVAGVHTRLVGRDAELEVLQRSFLGAVETHQGQLITIVGEPGIGKSRLVAEFEHWVDLQPVNACCFHGAATEGLSGTPYALLRDLFASRFAILESDSAAQARQKLEQEFSAYLGADAGIKVHVIGTLLGFDSAGVAEKDDPEQLRQQALFYLQGYFTALAEVSPLLLVFDDIHWADGPSLEAIRELAQRCRSSRLVVLCITRFRLFELHPEWEDSQPGLDIVRTRLDLAPLSRASSQQLAAQVLGRMEPVPQELSELLVSRSDGNPYYLEELVNMLIDEGVIVVESDTGSWQVDVQRLKSVRIPPTLTAVLQARLELLPADARHTLQGASVVGRSFWDSLLRAISKDGSLPATQLALLTGQKIVNPQAVSQFAGSQEYSFIHALFQDMVYHTLLKEQRRLIHAGVARWLAQAAESSGRVEEFAALIAWHCLLAQEKDPAADWSIRAGKRAVSQGAYPEAQRFFNQALDLLPPADLHRRWQALLGRDEVLGLLGDAPARLADDLALIDLARQMGDENCLAEAYTRHGYYLAVTGDERLAIQAYDAALQAAQQAGNVDAQVNVLAMQVVSLTRLGELRLAASLMQTALALLPQVKDELIQARALTNLSVYLSAIGDLSRAAQLMEQALAITRRLGDSAGETIVLNNLGYYTVVMGLPERGREALQRALSVAQKIGFIKSIVYSQLNLGLAYIRLGDSLAASQALEQALSAAAGVDHFADAVGYTYLGLAAEEAGDPAAAHPHFAEAWRRLEALDVPGNGQDALAGLARGALSMGETGQALDYADRVWEYLAKNGSQALEFPILAYQTCAQVFAAAGDHVRGEAAVRRGYRELQERLGKISDPAWQKAFLENIPEHRVITRLGNR